MNSHEKLVEFKVGGMSYDNLRTRLSMFNEGLQMAFETLVPVTQACQIGTERTDLMDLQKRLVDSIKAGVSMMAETLADVKLSESDNEEAARRFTLSIQRLAEEWRGTTARNTSPDKAYIPGAQQDQAWLDTERFSAGIFRKESDQMYPGAQFLKHLTQSMNSETLEGRYLIEYLRPWLAKKNEGNVARQIHEYPQCVSCGKQLSEEDFSYGACKECGEEVPSDW